MPKKSSGARPRSRATAGVGTADDQLSESRDHTSEIALCHRILRIATGAILGAFLLIIAVTTVSTGPGVRFVAQGLYYVILTAAIASLVVWFARMRMEKRMGSDATHAPSASDVS